MKPISETQEFWEGKAATPCFPLTYEILLDKINDLRVRVEELEVQNSEKGNSISRNKLNIERLRSRLTKVEVLESRVTFLGISKLNSHKDLKELYIKEFITYSAHELEKKFNLKESTIKDICKKLAEFGITLKYSVLKKKSKKATDLETNEEDENVDE